MQTIYDRFRERGRWPTFAEVDRILYHQRPRLDAVAVLSTIPDEFMKPISLPLGAAESQLLKLSIKGVSLCEGSESDISLFLRALRWFALKERRFAPTDDAQSLSVTGTQLMRAFRISCLGLTPVRRLGELLILENWGWRVGGAAPDGDWNFTLERKVRRFGNVQTLDDYFAAQEKWLEESMSRHGMLTLQLPFETQASPVTLTPSSPYIGGHAIDLITSAAQSSLWQCDKLLTLIHELNDNYSRGNAHAALAVLRAIIDHVPPLFGHADFTHVANNYAWSKTDKSFMKQLVDTKPHGDDALHRNISKRAVSPLLITDLPPARCINRLLDECAGLLQNSE